MFKLKELNRFTRDIFPYECLVSFYRNHNYTPHSKIENVLNKIKNKINLFEKNEIEWKYYIKGVKTTKKSFDINENIIINIQFLKVENNKISNDMIINSNIGLYSCFENFNFIVCFREGESFLNKYSLNVIYDTLFKVLNEKICNNNLQNLMFFK
jgi:hypothetical protein